jgi:hypothetical protein
VAWRELLRLRQLHITVGVEQADGVVEVVEIDNQLVQHALVMLDLASDFAVLFDEASEGVGALDHLDLPFLPGKF